MVSSSSYVYAAWVYQDLQEFHSLAQLAIFGCHNLKSIPDLGELCFLTRLAIQNCSNITRLPEGSLKCLKSVEIGGYCEELDVFPSLNFIQHSHMTLEDLELKGNLMYLPTTITCLIKLEELDIWDCSKLKERCAMGRGAEWLKIAHIPKIIIR
ncbi:hypothetical protein CMV_018651 [Castanea mollissima]|uniref:Disease resistance protein n=1 Tax=Castanea mollissima TaxID=60419 RepID=A0A8J4VPE4_9ROSI|nr:hypothetical protein CMV_018651 [Castanea mollissima]